MYIDSLNDPEARRKRAKTVAFLKNEAMLMKTSRNRHDEIELGSLRSTYVNDEVGNFSSPSQVPSIDKE